MATMVRRVLWACVWLVAGLVAPLPLDDNQAKGFIGFSLFPPPARVEPLECVAADPLLTVGTCYHSQACRQAGGAPSGSCTTGGICCVFPVVCGGTVIQNRTWFVNRDFPGKSRDSGECLITIKKSISEVRQVRLDFQLLELEGPRRGRCVGDSLAVIRTNTTTRPNNASSTVLQIAPSLCGNNSGQHVYVEMDDREVGVRVVLDSNGLSRQALPQRQWRVLITQLDNQNAAPPGCLQYHRETFSQVRSLNYGSGEDFRDDLNYDICFSRLARSQKTDESCSRAFTTVELDQPLSYRHQRDLLKKKRSAEIRKLGNHSPPIQAIPDKKDVHEAFSDVISLVSKTVQEVQSGADLRDSVSQNYIINPLPLVQSYSTVQASSDNQDYITTMKVESSDQSPTKATEQEENMVTESVAEVLPIFYSEGNEAVISQIQRVVQQLQQQHLGITADNDQDSLIFSDVEEPLVQFTTYSPLSLSDAMVDEVGMNGEDTRNEDQALMQPHVAEESNINHSSGINELHDNSFTEEIVVETVITPDGPVLMLQNGGSVTSHKSSDTSLTEGQATSDNEGSATDVNSGISNEGLAISDEGSEATSDEGLTASDSLAAPDKGLVTHDEVPATSDEGSAIAAPDDDLATSIPDKDLATAFPNEDQATTLPSKDLTTAFPYEDLTTPFPDENLTTAFPDKDLTTAFPDKDLATDFPDENQAITFPSKDLTTPFPYEDLGTAFPDKDLATDFPDENQAITFPSKDLTTPFPYEDLGTAFPDEDLATAFLDEDLATAFLDEDLATVFPDEDLATALPDDSLATAFPDDNLATAFPDEDMATASTDEGLTAASSNEGLAVTTDEGLAAVSPDEGLAASSDEGSAAASPYEGSAATSDEGPVTVSNEGLATATPDKGPAVTSEEGLAATFDDLATAPDKNFAIASDGSIAASDKDPATASLDKGPVTISLDEGPATASPIEGPATGPSNEGLAAGSGEDLAEASYDKSPAAGSSDMGLVTASSVEGLTVASSDEGLTAAFSDEGLTSAFSDEGSTAASLFEDLTTVSFDETSTVDTLGEGLTVASTESLTGPIFIMQPVTASMDKGSAAAPLDDSLATFSNEDLTTSLNKGQATSDEDSTTNESPAALGNGGMLGLKQTSVIVDQADFGGNVDNVDLMIEKMKDHFLTNYLVNDYQLPAEMDMDYDYDNEHNGDGGLNIMLEGNSGEDIKIPEAEMEDDGIKKVAPIEDGNPLTTDLDTDEESITSSLNLTGDSFLVSASNHTSTSGVTSALDMTSSTYLNSGLDPTSSLDAGSALAELTVVDPERVQVHGNLVIMDHSEEATETLTNGMDEKIGNQSAVTPHPLNAEDEGSDDEHGEDLLMSHVEPGEVVSLESGSILTHDPVEGIDPESFSSTNQESIQDLGDGIQWLILGDSATVDDGAASFVLTVPPEIVITSGIGFGSSNTEQYDLLVTTKLESSTALPNEVGILGEENDRETSTHNDVDGGENVKESQEESIPEMAEDLAVELAGDNITEVVGEDGVMDAAKKENTTKETTDTFTEVVEEENIMKTGEGENPVVTIGEYDIGVYGDNPGIYEHTTLPDTLEDEMNSLESDDGATDNNTDESEGNIAVFSSSVDVDDGAIYVSVDNSGAGLLPVSMTETSVNNSVKDTTIQDSTVDPIINDGTVNTAADTVVDDYDSISDGAAETVVDDSIVDTTTGNNTVDITVDNSPVDITINDSVVDTTLHESAIATALDVISVDAAVDGALDTVVDNSEMDFAVDDGSVDTSVDEGAVDATVDITATDSVLHSGAVDAGIDSAVHVTVPVDDNATDNTIDDNLIETTVNDNAANASVDITADTGAAHITIEDSAVNTTVESAVTATVYDDAMDSGVDSSATMDSGVDNSAANTITDSSVMVSSLDDSTVDSVLDNSTMDIVIGDGAADNTTRGTTQDSVAENAIGSNGVADTVIRDAANSGAINTVPDISEVGTVIANSAVASVVGPEEDYGTGDTIVDDSEGDTAGDSSEADIAVDDNEVDTAVDDSEVSATVANSEAVTEVNSDTADTIASDSVANTTASITLDGNAPDTAVVDNSGTLSGVEDGPVEDEHECGGSFLMVNDLVICGSQLRFEPIFDEDYEDDRFQDVERVSVRTLEGAARSLRFSLEYNTTCPVVEVPTTPKPPGRKTVTLLQYLLGWYR